jgi:hypothetical protein
MNQLGVERYKGRATWLIAILTLSGVLMSIVFGIEKEARDIPLKHDLLMLTVLFLSLTIVGALLLLWLTYDYFQRLKKRPWWMNYMSKLYAAVVILFISSIALFVLAVI